MGVVDPLITINQSTTYAKFVRIQLTSTIFRRRRMRDPSREEVGEPRPLSLLLAITASAVG